MERRRHNNGRQRTRATAFLSCTLNGRSPLMPSVRPLSFSMNAEKVRKDFDEIARLADQYGGGTDRYDSFLLSLIPGAAVSVLDVGCGLGRLTAKLATDKREVLGVDLSPEMIARARRRAGATQRVSFLCGDFLLWCYTIVWDKQGAT